MAKFSWHRPLFLLALVTLSGGCASTFAPQAQLAPAGQDEAALFPGIRYEMRMISGASPARAHIIHINLAQPGLRLAVTPADTSGGMEHVAKLTSGYLTEYHAQIAINASYFLPFKGGSRGGEDYYPHVGDPVNISGAAMAGGRLVSPVETEIDDRVDSMLCFDRARVLIVDGQICPTDYKDGVAIGPRLLSDGKIIPSSHDYASRAHPRTAFGVSRDRKKAWIIVVDGRQPDSIGMTLPDLTALFLKLGASDATNLDGGGSATLAAEGPDGRAYLLNRSIHTGITGRERPVANHIGIFIPHHHQHEAQGTQP